MKLALEDLSGEARITVRALGEIGCRLLARYERFRVSLKPSGCRAMKLDSEKRRAASIAPDGREGVTE